MEKRHIYTPPGGPPQVQAPHPDIYLHMGEENIFKMLLDFYKELEQSSIHEMFPGNMVEASQRSAAFFVGLLGGPPLFQERYGPPMLRARHLPFVINNDARLVWLDCFDRILKNAEKEYHFPSQHIEGFRSFLHAFSSWMVNHNDSSTP